ncbi:putative multidrug resistance protein NorM [Pullulanibacillus camelliae]|uniref:Probable multidrug resistance protein NorM n=1 Tax=Pullulanibacillus camelliae TaxID=1707096 RepID=A0A8J2YH12_9BACL|nr:MATE family efflux transporter [Pullulanibacillus camelliae]GGE39624.1 putative multidrug resistance protein NorM [Pullulanibacillus camelliae]
MYPTHRLSEKLKVILTLLFPILVTQIGLSAMSFFDTLMSGHAGTNDLAGVAIGSSLWMPVYTGLSGILIAITTLISNHLGRKRQRAIPFTLMQGIYLSIAIALAVVIIGGVVLQPILNAMELTEVVQSIAKRYLHALAIGILPLFVYGVLRNFMDAHGKTTITMVITLCSLPINILFNYLFIFGKFGFPRLGGVGTGYATAITYWIIALIALIVIIRVHPFASYKPFRHVYKISFKEWKAQLKIGVPIGFAIFFETSIFSAVTLFMSRYGTVTVAAHQAALNFEALLFMVPLSIAMALTIAVGYENGSGRYQDAKTYSFLGIGLAIIIACVLSIFLYTFRESFARLYTEDSHVLQLTSHFLIYAVFFQLSDALQAPIQGALRGYKDVNVALILTLIAYWIIGLPLGYILAAYTGLGPYGYWVGLICGLALGAIGLALRLITLQKQEMHQSIH